ncbi:hypothetical protein ABNG03_04880 [Halorubrum sp. RMP-47]|uniref:Transporter n=1 Tax=Halorubrum miltondacostae TaxID=3076378 RepID=A0ABD5M830_9EURY
MGASHSVNSGSQAVFIGTLLFGALLLAIGTATSLFSVTTTYYSTATDQWLAVAVSVLFLVAGIGIIVRTLK